MNIAQMITPASLTFFGIAILALVGILNAPIALAVGLVYSFAFTNPFLKSSQRWSKKLLQWSVVGLGFGMNIQSVVAAGTDGLAFTTVSILLTLSLGYVLGRALHVAAPVSTLVSAGTAICGGSAIAAVAPVIEADAKSISVAMAIVFVLNALALFIFPVIGHLLGLTQQQFGLWSAIAIHDTSSVVGAASRYGDEALKIATTVKLSRALWIIPVTMLFAIIYKKKNSRVSIPWFIGFFIVAAAIATWLPAYKPVYNSINMLAKNGLTLTLFLIGTSLSPTAIKEIGFKPFVQAIILWLFISIAGLAAVYHLA